MKYSTVFKRCSIVVAVLAVCLAISACSDSGSGGGLPSGIIDAHAHLSALTGSASDFTAAAEAAIAKMDELGIARTIIMPTPFPDNWARTYDSDPLAAVVAAFPTRFYFVAGGGSLNVLIQRAVAGGVVTPAEFAAAAQSVLASGAIGFGELAAEHIVIGGTEPYVHAPPDHALFKQLADICAAANVPMDLHMEAVPSAMPIPARFASAVNPTTLEANIDRFETLLDHNTGARIIWAHLGWDTTGQRTATLCRGLLSRHTNLYMGIKRTIDAQQNALIDGDGNIIDEWLQLLQDYPDRFILGSDQFHLSPGTAVSLPDGAASTVDVLSVLPAALAERVAKTNVEAIYNL